MCIAHASNEIPVSNDPLWANLHSNRWNYVKATKPKLEEFSDHFYKTYTYYLNTLVLSTVWDDLLMILENFFKWKVTQ